jgi:tetratricopeptide (TPR) repeat protein
MNVTSKFLLSASALAVLIVLSAPSGFAQDRHPAYLHALTDLRHARAHLERPAHGELREQEKKAIHEIDEAIGDIKRASIDDGKHLNDHPPVDARLDWSGRLHRAIELIDKAHNDISREEDNRFAQGLQVRALEHIDKAHRHAEEALQIARGR